MRAAWAKFILLIVAIAVMYWLVGYQLKVDTLTESVRVSDSIIFCYEHGEYKGVRPHLRKDGEVR